MLGTATLDELIDRWDGLSPLQRRRRVQALAEDQQRHLDAKREHEGCAEQLAEVRARNGELLDALAEIADEVRRHREATRLTERGELHAARLSSILGRVRPAARH